MSAPHKIIELSQGRRGGFVKTRNVNCETYQRRVNLRISPPTVEIPISCVSPR